MLWMELSPMPASLRRSPTLPSPYSLLDSWGEIKSSKSIESAPMRRPPPVPLPPRDCGQIALGLHDSTPVLLLGRNPGRY